MKKINQYFKAIKWAMTGRPTPPPHIVKQKMVLDSLRQYGPRILVETGTLLGDMVDAMKRRFSRIYSIEISPELARRAQARFAKHKHIEIIENDSAIALKELTRQLDEPVLFWLDGHYSGGSTGKGEKNTPIMEELNSILSRNVHDVILIDDARCFGTVEDYPSLAELESHVHGQRPDLRIFIKNDCIHILPPSH